MVPLFLNEKRKHPKTNKPQPALHILNAPIEQTLHSVNTNNKDCNLKKYQ